MRRKLSLNRRGASAPPGLQAPALKRHLSPVDTAFLSLERKEIPLNIAGVCVFDGPIPFNEFVAAIDSKLHLIPRYRQVVVAPPFNLDYPTWEHDRHFDIRRHIFHVRLDAPGGAAELEALAGRIFSQVMDRGKPLWEIYVVDGLKDGRGALIPRLHHALADGVAGASLIKIMLDPTREGSRAGRKPRLRRQDSAPADHSLAGALSHAVSSTLGNWLEAGKSLLGFAEGLASGRMSASLEGLAGLLPELAASVERLPFNRPCTGERKFCWAEMDFAAVEAIRAALGGTVNDVVLTVVSRALSRYVKMHGQTVSNRYLRVLCPVSLRSQGQDADLGNRISFLPVALPMDVPDPATNLKAVATRTAIMKGAGAADLVALAAGCLAAAPPPLQSLFWSAIGAVSLPLPLFNIICTNVPGSPAPLYAAGRRMLTCYPQVPTGNDMGVGVAVQSYDGKLFFGLTADAQAAPDVTSLRDFFYGSFQELCQAAGIKKATGRARPAHKGRKRPAKPRPEPEATVEAQVSGQPAQPGPEISAPRLARSAESGA